MNNAKIGAAVVGGYMLGRTKKARLALGLGALLAGSRMRPGQLVKSVQDSPFLNTITEQVRTELSDAGKAAATSVLTAKADSLAAAIHERTAGLYEKGHADGERDRDDDPEARQEEEDEEAEDEGRQEEDREADEHRSRSGEAHARRRPNDG
ncbi:hypothetical protein [Streptomyces sp. NK08204]|uniref:hypothetical protein n=1 Tax=Streptomyces sp. NK08204 TaxID=2873260 RepID=UPI001CEC91CC|nr:hypothetical protein [Streptomyces sp. NK08204]